MKFFIAKKTGRWAQPEPHKKQIIMSKDMIYNKDFFPTSMLDMFIDKGFIDHYVITTTVEEPEPELPKDNAKEPHGANMVSSAVMTGMNTDQPLASTEDLSSNMTSNTPSHEEQIDSIIDTSIPKNVKSDLEAWGKRVLNIDIDKRKSVGTIRAKLIEASNVG